MSQGFVNWIGHSNGTVSIEICERTKYEFSERINVLSDEDLT